MEENLEPQDELEEMVPPVPVQDRDDTEDDLMQGGLEVAPYQGLEDGIIQDEEYDDLLNKKSFIPDWDVLRSRYETNNSPGFQGPDLYQLPSTEDEQGPGETQDTGQTLTTNRRSKRKTNVVQYKGLSNDVFVYHNNSWSNLYQQQEYPKVVQSCAFSVISPARPAPPSLPGEPRPSGWPTAITSSPHIEGLCGQTTANTQKQEEHHLSQRRQTGMLEDNWASFVNCISGRLLLKLIILFVFMLSLPPVAGIPCQGVLRLDVEALRETNEDFKTTIKQLRTITDNQQHKPTTFFFNSRKTIRIIDDKHIPPGTLQTTDNYDKLLVHCTKQGLIPLTFSYNERFRIYQLMQDFGFPKVVLNVLSTTQSVVFGGNGQISHFDSLLATSLTTDLKKQQLKYIYYSVNKSGAETVSVINSPFTLTQYGDGTKHFHPFLCEPQDQTTNGLLALGDEVFNFVTTNSALLTNYTAELQSLLNDTIDHVKKEGKTGIDCPAIEIFQSQFVPLFPFEGINSLPMTLPDVKQEKFLHKWRDLQQHILATPTQVKRGRKLLQYADIIPSRNNYLYLFSSEFYQKLSEGEPFEVLITICMAIITIVTCCVFYCLRQMCCKNVPIVATLMSFGKLCPSWSTMSGHFQQRLAGANPGQEEIDETSFPLRAYGQNFVTRPSRHGGSTSNRFQITVSPANHNTNRPLHDVIEI